MVSDSTPKSKGKPGRPKKNPTFSETLIQPEMMDNEEVCDVEMLEEWLDEDDTFTDFGNATEPEEFVELVKSEIIEMKSEEEFQEDIQEEHISETEEVEEDTSMILSIYQFC